MVGHPLAISMISVLELFSIGIGPSSSHTVGPMRAARRFLSEVAEMSLLSEVDSIKIELYGSLAMTGKGHATDTAILLGLEGETPEGVDPDAIAPRVFSIQNGKSLNLLSEKRIAFNVETDLLFLKGKKLPYHSNGMRFKVLSREWRSLFSKVFYSIGGGFILDHEEAMAPASQTKTKREVPYPFKTARELLEKAESLQKAIWEVVWKNELALRPAEEMQEGVFQIWKAMKTSVERGLVNRGILPGGLGVKRRAPDLFDALLKQKEGSDPALVMDWVSLYAIAVNEENAAGSRVVTAPTNGSAGVIPAVLHYCGKYLLDFNEEKLFIFFLTAGAIGILFKEGASISAAEMGCQGEIGVSSAMAAAGLAAVMGGTNKQIENAAEIAMEHHLGMTCDPIGGLVQIPCIERNAMGAVKAINAARLAMRGDGDHIVSLDAVIAAMKETGINMKSIYKETSEGGLAAQLSIMEPVC